MVSIHFVGSSGLSLVVGLFILAESLFKESGGRHGCSLRQTATQRAIPSALRIRSTPARLPRPAGAGADLLFFAINGPMDLFMAAGSFFSLTQ